MTRDRRHDPLGTGLGLRAPHFDFILRERPAVSWFEAISENFMGIEGGTGARPLQVLEKIRADYPIVLHGVSLNIGSTNPLSRAYLDKLKALVERVQPAWISDHLCWTGVGGENLHDLLPLPYTIETLEHLVPRILQAQEYLGRPLLLENVSAYLEFPHSEMTEWEFLSELARRTDCQLLLDVNNVYVSAQNLGFDPLAFLKGLPAARIGQMHLAGHSTRADGFLIDTHDAPIREEVWELYRTAVELVGPVPALIERDDKIPELPELLKEVERATTIRERCHAD